MVGKSVYNIATRKSSLQISLKVFGASSTLNFPTTCLKSQLVKNKLIILSMNYSYSYGLSSFNTQPLNLNKTIEVSHKHHSKVIICIDIIKFLANTNK